MENRMKRWFTAVELTVLCGLLTVLIHTPAAFCRESGTTVPGFLEICEANDPEALLAEHGCYDRISTFYYKDGWERRVYSYCGKEQLIRDQEDEVICFSSGRMAGYSRIDGSSFAYFLMDGTEDEIRSRMGGSFTYDPDEQLDYTEVTDGIRYLVGSADVIIHFPLLKELGFRAAGDDWITCEYYLDSETYQMKEYSASLMHADGTGDLLNRVTWRYGEEVPEPEADGLLEETLQKMDSAADSGKESCTFRLISDPGTEEEKSGELTIPRGFQVRVVFAPGFEETLYEDSGCTIPAAAGNPSAEENCTYYVKKLPEEQAVG